MDLYGESARAFLAAIRNESYGCVLSCVGACVKKDTSFHYNHLFNLSSKSQTIDNTCGWKRE